MRYPPVWNDIATAVTLADPRGRDADAGMRTRTRRQGRWVSLSVAMFVAGVLLSSGIRSLVQARVEQSMSAPRALVRQPPGPVIVPIPRPTAPAPLKGLASAGDSLAAIAELNDTAMAAYQGRNFRVARALLLEALAGEQRLHLQQHPVAAVTHAYLGIVLVSGLGQWQPGVAEFRQAVSIDPDVTLPRQFVKRAVTAAIRQAVTGS